jgi:hypothetical protein
MSKILFILIVLIIFIIFLYTLDKICNTELKYYIYDSKIPGNTILLIGGTHGNEPAGSDAIKELQEGLNNKNINLKRGKLILIPEVNHCALRLGLRYIPFLGDMNRKYPCSNNEKCSNNIINKIIHLSSNADFIIDFHEGWGFNRIEKKSMGSTITPTDTKESLEKAQHILNKLNDTIEIKHKKFLILTNNIPLNEENSNTYDYNESIDIKGSLKYFMNMHKKNYILVETTGQNDIQPLHIRTNQNKIIIDTILKEYNII